MGTYFGPSSYYDNRTTGGVFTNPGSLVISSSSIKGQTYVSYVSGKIKVFMSLLIPLDVEVTPVDASGTPGTTTRLGIGRQVYPLICPTTPLQDGVDSVCATGDSSGLQELCYDDGNLTCAPLGQSDTGDSPFVADCGSGLFFYGRQIWNFTAGTYNLGCGFVNATQKAALVAEAFIPNPGDQNPLAAVTCENGTGFFYWQNGSSYWFYKPFWLIPGAVTPSSSNTPPTPSFSTTPPLTSSTTPIPSSTPLVIPNFTVPSGFTEVPVTVLIPPVYHSLFLSISALPRGRNWWSLLIQTATF